MTVPTAILGLVMRNRRFPAIVVAIMWILLGPVGMTFTCAAMDGCDALCTTSAAVRMPTAVASEAPLNWLTSSLDGHLPLNSGQVLDAPPKFAPPSL